MTLRLTWRENPEWKQLPDIHVGDMVFLEPTSTFDYFLQVIVTSVTDEKVVGDVRAVFDKATSMPMGESDMKELEGKELSAPRRMIHKVVPKPN